MNLTQNPVRERANNAALSLWYILPKPGNMPQAKQDEAVVMLSNLFYQEATKSEYGLPCPHRTPARYFTAARRIAQSVMPQWWGQMTWFMQIAWMGSVCRLTLDFINATNEHIHEAGMYLNERVTAMSAMTGLAVRMQIYEDEHDRLPQ